MILYDNIEIHEFDYCTDFPSLMVHKTMVSEIKKDELCTSFTSDTTSKYQVVICIFILKIVRSGSEMKIHVHKVPLRDIFDNSF